MEEKKSAETTVETTIKAKDEDVSKVDPKKAKRQERKEKIKKGLKIAGGAIGAVTAVAAAILFKKQHDEYRATLIDDPVHPGSKLDPNIEHYVSEMADENGNIHKNVLCQRLDEDTTAYWFQTSEIDRMNESDE